MPIPPSGAATPRAGAPNYGMADGPAVAENFYIGDGWARSLRGKLDALPADAPLTDRWLLMFQLGEAELNLGREAEAIELMTEASPSTRPRLSWG